MEVKIIMFQYKVIHNVVPTRATLYRDGLLEKAICNLCNTEEQSLHHMLMSCVVTTGFWTLFQNWWHTKQAKT